MSVTGMSDSRQGELWRRLQAVTDPELDESVVAMGFVERAEIMADGSVEVEFRLPTYWCSPNFAFLMLDDIRLCLEGLPWQPHYRIRLLDHVLDAEINAGLAAGKRFGDIVDRLAPDADIVGLRALFSMKAFKRRQEAVVLGLRAIGLGEDAILSLTDSALAALATDQADLAEPAQRYRTAWQQRFPQDDGSSLAFRTWEGAAITTAVFPAYMAELRSVRINMEFNGALCRGLKQSRYQEALFGADGPTLVDFIRGTGVTARRSETSRQC